MKNSGLFVAATKWKNGRKARRPKMTSAVSPSTAGPSVVSNCQARPRSPPAEKAPTITSSGATARS